ncbi:MAG: hypothetical protein IKF90_05755 [Parasporobacterium sp.]|nr:hypothetical protein [Parasporobacterium sp.]
MLYQGYVVRHLNPRDYKDPFIGLNAYRVQIVNVKKDIENEVTKRIRLREEHAGYANAAKFHAGVNLDILKLYMNAPAVLKGSEDQLAVVKAELKTAQNDPTLIELTGRLNETEKELGEKKADQERENKELYRLTYQIETQERELADSEKELEEKELLLKEAADSYGAEYLLANEKYKSNLKKNKDPQTILRNFSPQKTQFENEKQELLSGKRGLYSLQAAFNSDFSMDFMTGISEKYKFREAAEKLRKVEIVKYEEKLRAAREDCEKIFRSDFLSKMKEHIENAKLEFRNLNKALENVYYGDDSYHFTITYDKRKENLYRMITSEYNMEGVDTLWSHAFETEYKDEIEDLFAKLMAGDDKGEKVIEEYTDYRSYLDYDIEIRKKNGTKQRFSDIYGEKSGSETQVPYYVAIAASFYQLYRFGNSVRLILLDEAFDKMDDDRIQSMMDFIKSLKLQVILATPPAKLEVIGEHVDTILTAIRVENRSIVEEYEL